MPPAVSKPALERDAVVVDPQHYKVELDNDKVRVVRITYEGHEKSPMHQHPPGVGVFLTGGKFRFTYPDGRSEELESKAGEFIWFPELWEHMPEMLDDGHFEVLYIETKS